MRQKPPAKIESEQLNIRLPLPMIADLQNAAKKAGRPLSKEIRERLAGSFFDDVMRSEDPGLPDILNQISELSRRVRRHYGASWRVDANALGTFKEVVGRLIADLPEPDGPQAETKHPPALVGEVIYRSYVAERREYAETGTLEIKMRSTAAGILEGRK